MKMVNTVDEYYSNDYMQVKFVNIWNGKVSDWVLCPISKHKIELIMEEIGASSTIYLYVYECQYIPYDVKGASLEELQHVTRILQSFTKEELALFSLLSKDKSFEMAVKVIQNKLYVKYKYCRTLQDVMLLKWANEGKYDIAKEEFTDYDNPVDIDKEVQEELENYNYYQLRRYYYSEHFYSDIFEVSKNDYNF